MNISQKNKIKGCHINSLDRSFVLRTTNNWATIFSSYFQLLVHHSQSILPVKHTKRNEKKPS